MTASGKSPRTKKTAAEPLPRRLLKVVAATLLLVALVAAAGLAVICLVPVRGPAVKPAPPASTPAATAPVFEIYPREKKPLPPASPEAGNAVPPPPPPLPSAGGPPRITIIIDDIGYDRKIARQLIAIDPSLTLSILPGSPFRREIAAAAREAGLEVMLHLPMEPVEYPGVDPGPGVLLTGMAPDALIGQLEADIDDIPDVKGVNNHMGSKLTAESAQLYQVLSVLKRRDLFFVDSRTTEKSLCRPSARKLQVPFAERDVFLDNTLSEAEIRRQLNHLADIAVRHGKAVGIGHPHPETCRVLAEQLPLIRERAQLVPASVLVAIPE